MTGCGHEHEDGAYVLGALDPGERVTFERHLETCEPCTRSVRELAGLPGLLARVPVERVSAEQAPLPVTDTLLPRLLARVRRARRRRRVVAAGLVAAAFAGGAVATGAVVHLTDAPPAASSSTAPRQQFTSVGDAHVSGWASLTQVAWGTKIELTCSYARAAHDYASDPTYTVAITRRDGSTEDVGSWTAQPGREMRVTAATSADKADITRVVVRNAAGDDVMQLVTG